MFYDFIKDNYKWLIAGLYAIILLIILIVKKQIKVVDIVKQVILEVLPDVIVQAEEKYGSGHGEEKLVYCVNVICETISQKYGINDMTVFKIYRPYIEQSIEKILSTPKKK